MGEREGRGREGRQLVCVPAHPLQTTVYYRVKRKADGSLSIKFCLGSSFPTSHEIYWSAFSNVLSL